MFVKHKNYNLPDKDGFFGEFGGMFVPENFKPVLRKLDEEFEKAIKDENFEKEVLQADKTVLADFYSDSCVPCKRLSPVLFALEEEYAEKLKIVKININFDSELAEKYEVQAAPTLVFFKNGEEISRLRGAVKQAEIKEVIEKSV